MHVCQIWSRGDTCEDGMIPKLSRYEQNIYAKSNCRAVVHFREYLVATVGNMLFYVSWPLKLLIGDY